MNVGRQHEYVVKVKWTGNLGSGTSDYRAYSRDHEVSVKGRTPIAGSADPAFRGNASRYNPEDMLVAALSSCHMLWYLHLCADAGIPVLEYEDDAWGAMSQGDDGGGRFERVVLRPRITLAADGDRELAMRLHGQAHHLCFIANSVNFPVECEPDVALAEE